MSRRANPTIVGIFVLGAVALGIASLVLYGSGWLKDRYTFVLDFGESLDGLAQGSPVKFRGITVGSVSRIVMQFDDQGNVRTPVYIELTGGQIEGTSFFDDPEEFLQHLIQEMGLRAELRTQSFVTGQLAVALVYRPEVPIHLTGVDTAYTEIPTARSAFAEFTESLERIRLDDFISNLNELLSDVRQVIDTLPLASTLDSMQVAVSDLRRLINNFDGRSETLTGSADSALAAFKRAADRAGPVMAEAEGLLESTRGAEGPLTTQLIETLEEMGRAARSFRLLAEFVERNPNALLFGKGEREETEESEP